MILQDQQARQDALHCGQSFIVQAPAGSGKTGVLTLRILGLLALVKKPEEILAITFTKKAAKEMRHRVIDALQFAAQNPEPDNDYDAKIWRFSQKALARDKAEQWHLLQNPNRLKIQTIDGLCSSLVKQMPLTSGMGSAPRIEEDASVHYDNTAQLLINSLDDETPYQASVVSLLNHLDNNYFVATRLIAQMLAKRDHWLDDLYSARAHGDNLKSLLESTLETLVSEKLAALADMLDPDIQHKLIQLSLYSAHTLQQEGVNSPILKCLELDEVDVLFHSVSAWQGIAELILTKGKPAYRKAFNKTVGIFPATGSKDPDEKQQRTYYKKLAAELTTELSDRYPTFNHLLNTVRILPDTTYPESQWLILQDLLQVMPVAVALLNLCWQETGSVDFTEISMSALSALGDSEAPTDLALTYDYRISHILVDEFQDTSITQIELLEKLTTGWEPSDGRTLFLVGDPMQGIYSFRKADVGLFLKVWHSKQLGHIALTPLSLVTNFRSDTDVVDWVNQVFQQALPCSDDVRTGGVSYSASVAAKPEKPSSGVALQVYRNTYQEVDDEVLFYPDKEADWVAQQIATIKQTACEDSIAVLVRSKSHARLVIAELKARQIGYRAVDIDTLDDSCVIQGLLALTRAYLRPSDRIAWYSVLRSPWCGLTLGAIYGIHHLGTRASIWTNLTSLVTNPQHANVLETTQHRCVELLVSVFNYFYSHRKQASLRDTIASMWQQLGGEEAITSPQQFEDADKFFSILESLDISGDIDDFVMLEEKAMSVFASPGEVTGNPVDIMTMHKSKGLEFDHVFLPYTAKRGRSDDQPLLIIDKQTSHQDAQQELLLAAKPEGGEDDALYAYLWSLQSQRLHHELARLAYVACTRAKKNLYVSATLSSDKKDELKPPPEKTLLGTLWNALNHNALVQTEPVDPQVVEETELLPIPVFSDDKIEQLIARQAETNQLVVIQNKQQTKQVKCSEESQDTNVEGHDNISSTDSYHTAAGTFVHRLYQQFANQKCFTLRREHVTSLIPVWSQALASLGVEEDDLAAALNVVERAIQHLIDNPDKAAWLFSENQQHAFAEHPISYNDNGQVSHYSIDRTFVDDQGVRWIVDYKLSEDHAGSVDVFLQQQFKRYQGQLERYSEILNTADPRPTKLMLYFPLMNEAYTWPAESI